MSQWGPWQTRPALNHGTIPRQPGPHRVSPDRDIVNGSVGVLVQMPHPVSSQPMPPVSHPACGGPLHWAGTDALSKSRSQGLRLLRLEATTSALGPEDCLSCPLAPSFTLRRQPVPSQSPYRSHPPSGSAGLCMSVRGQRLVPAALRLTGGAAPAFGVSTPCAEAAFAQHCPLRCKRHAAIWDTWEEIWGRGCLAGWTEASGRAQPVKGSTRKEGEEAHAAGAAQ